MDKPKFIAALVGLSLASVTLVTAAVGSGPRSSLFSPQEYDAATESIEETVRVSLTTCRKLPGIEKKLCVAEVRADEKIRKADLDARYLGTFDAAFQAQVTRVHAQFDVEKLKCEVQPSDGKDACVEGAAAQREKTLETLQKPA